MTLLCNADMGPAQVREYCKLEDAGESLLKSRHRLGGSALGHAATGHERARLPPHPFASLRAGLKPARTIADLEGVAEIKTHHLADAIQYRPRKQT